MSIRKIIEADGGINLLEELLKLLTAYDDQYPASGVDGMLDALRTRKTACLPNNELSKDIILYAITQGTFPAGGYQNLTNMRFCDLPLSLRPMYEDDHGKRKVASWKNGDAVSDKIVSMLNFAGAEGDKGFSCHSGDKVELLKKP